MLRDYGFDVDGDYPDDATGTDTALFIEWLEYGKHGSDLDELIHILARFAPSAQRIGWYWEGDNASWWVNRFEHGTRHGYPTRVVIDDGRPPMTAALAAALDPWPHLRRTTTGPDTITAAELAAAADRLAELWDHARPRRAALTTPTRTRR